ncbi:MAG TPA: putative metal-binding motif-containing protein, partial [Myxococcota bacterium]|nr:putative metal-binding motif-containing protein [Myxococcota bacterium]
DCDDSQAAMYPGAPEICDGLDNNCDGDVDLNATDATSWYQDLDADGYGAGEAIVACTAPADRLPTGDDCDDTNAAINPGMIEVCDPRNVDEDCNGMADDADQSADPSTWTSSWVDADGDGYGDPSLQLWTCEIPAGCVTDGSDCDDADGELWSGSPGLCDVVLVSKDVYRQEDGTETEVAVDPYTDYLAVEAWVGGASVASGQLVDGGGVEIAGVPAGPYTLFRESLPGSTWVAGARGNQVWVDMPSRMYSKIPIWAGRSNVSSATQATMVELDATGLSPLNVQTWVEASGDYVGANDQLEFYSYNADALLTVVLDPEDSSLGVVPAAGDTVLNGLSLDWSDAVSYVHSAGPLVDAAQGDGLVVTHLAGTRVQDSSRSDGWADFTWYTPVDSVSLSQTFVDGGSHLLQVAFSPAPSSPFDLDFRGDSFSAELEARGP